jgi:hypothetical protein
VEGGYKMDMSLLDEALNEYMFMLGDVDVPVVREDYTQYLCRDKRIFSLARRHLYKEKPVVMMLPAAKAAGNMTIEELSAYVGRRLINAVKDKIMCSENKLDISCLLHYIRPELLSHYTFRCPTKNEAKVYLAKNKCKKAELVAIENAGKNWVVNMAQATRKSSITRGWLLRPMNEIVYLHDAALFFGWLAVMSEVTSYLLSVKEKDEDMVYRDIEDVEDKLCSTLEDVVCNKDELGTWLGEQYGIKTDENGCKLPITYFPEYMITHNSWDVGMIVSGEGYARAFCRLRLIEEQKRLQDREARRIADSYATCFMTKKNIPDKVIRAMSASKLNNHFGFVEFDEEVDLRLVKEFERDFEALQTILHQTKKADYEIRLRKLGRHHAAGLYFPTLHCLCVDLRMVWSTAHEYFHLLDYHYGSLSMTASFAPVYERYCSSLNKDAIKASCGKSKYDYEYYTMPTEVFARCGEMYLIRTLKVANSLVGIDGVMNFAYPNNEELMECINKYFGEVFIPKYCGQEDLI